MPGTLTPAQDYDHLITAKSGSDGMHDLQISATVETGATFNRGSLVYLNGNVRLAAGTDVAVMPLWAINASGDFDVNGDVGNFIDGKAAAWVATGGYEFFTTEFVAGTYAPNQLLTYATGLDSGKVTASPTNYNDAAVLGCVSSGIGTDVYNQSILNFWSMFIPPLHIR